MTNTRIPLVLVSLVMLVSAVAVAAAGDRHDSGDRRGHGGPHGMAAMHIDPARMVERLTRRLDLDETQQASIENIITAVKPEAEALQQRGRANREALRDLDPAEADYSAALNNLALQSGQIVTDSALLMGRVRAEVFALLTPEQIEELESMRDRWQDRRDQRRR